MTGGMHDRGMHGGSMHGKGQAVCILLECITVLNIIV